MYTYDLGNGKSERFRLNIKKAGQPLLGDVNMDGMLSILDATAIQQHLVMIDGITFDESVADFNNDGSISILDATAIQKNLVGLD